MLLLAELIYHICLSQAKKVERSADLSVLPPKIDRKAPSSSSPILMARYSDPLYRLTPKNWRMNSANSLKNMELLKV